MATPPSRGSSQASGGGSDGAEAAAIARAKAAEIARAKASLYKLSKPAEARDRSARDGSADAPWALTSAGIFNRLRRVLEETDRYLQLSDGQVKNLDLSLHDLSDCRISMITFDNVQFGDIENADFAGCTFKNCSFVGRIGRNPNLRGGVHLQNVVFYECTLDGTHFSRSHLSDIKIASCRFIDVPRFDESDARGTVMIVQSGNMETFRRLPDLSMRTESGALFTDIAIKRRLGFDWEHLRSVAQIPFLQASLVGLTLLVAQVSLIEFLLALAGKPEQICRSMKVFVADKLPPKMLTALDASCAHLDPGQLDRAVSSGLSETLLLFVCLFIASLAHKLGSPSEVLEYSYNQWRVDNDRPGLFYKILAQERWAWLIVVSLFYAIALLIFGDLIGSKVVAVLTAKP